MDRLFLLVSVAHHICFQILGSASSTTYCPHPTVIQGISQSLWLLEPSMPSWESIVYKGSISPSTYSLLICWVSATLELPT